MRSGRVARLAGVDDGDAAAGTAEHQGSGQSGCAAADDDDVVARSPAAQQWGVLVSFVLMATRVTCPIAVDNGCCCFWERAVQSAHERTCEQPQPSRGSRRVGR